VTAEAKYIGRKGKLFDFEIMASDAAGEIGRGGHERAIVISSKLEGVAEGRKKTVEEESKK
jgi:predicted thioesterase